jgi:hypothetical protein
MKAILILSVAFLLAGCNSQYRYPCQDPANWDKDECNNQVCKAEGDCTSDLLAPKAAEDMIDDGLIEDTSLDANTTPEAETGE